jgi:hypothetical protein
MFIVNRKSFLINQQSGGLIIQPVKPVVCSKGEGYVKWAWQSLKGRNAKTRLDGFKDLLMEKLFSLATRRSNWTELSQKGCSMHCKKTFENPLWTMMALK